MAGFSELDAHNQPRIEQLGRAFQSSGVAVFVGAGSSIACGYPGWTVLLDQLIDQLPELSDKRRQELRRRDARTQIDDIAELLGDRYPETFFKTFEPPENGLSPPEWLRVVYDLPLRVLLTTNYTTELEYAARFHPSSPLGDRPTPVRWYDSSGVTHALRRVDGRLRLVYFHGRYDDSPAIQRDVENHEWSPVILGERSYRFAYLHPGSLARRLDAICQTMTLLTIGASLRDEDVTGVLRSVRAFSGPGYPPHYAIVPVPEDQGLEPAAREYRDRLGIEPIFYQLGADVAATNYAMEQLLRGIVEVADPPPAIEPAQAKDLPTALAAWPAPRVVHPLLRALDFEPRPMYRQMIDSFLRRPEGGVMALVGIGGAGKTALVRDALDGVLAGTAPPLQYGLFIWSFYDQPNANLFLYALSSYLGAAVGRNPSEAAALDAVRRGCRHAGGVVIVLDGLEKLQLERPEHADIHGAVENNSLRELLLWLAESGTSARALITTRFPIPDLQASAASNRVSLIDLDSLTRREARALLRKRGVAGDDAILDELLDHFGAHALTVDHLGGVIATFLKGDASRYRELADVPLTRFETGQTSQKLVRVLAAYERYLNRHEPPVRDTLQRVALFSRPVSSALLASVFLNPARASRAGTLVGKTLADLENYLSRLVALRFIRREQSRREAVYSIHPAVRDAVLVSLGEDRRAVSTAAKEEMLQNLDTVSGKPGTNPSSNDALDFVEDLIEFCIQDGDFERGFELYRVRLGEYSHLAATLGQFDRGERISRMLGEAAARFSPPRREKLAVDRSLYLLHLGRLREATLLLREWSRVAVGGRASSIAINLAEAEWLQGLIPASLQTLDQGGILSKNDDLCQALAFRARAALAMGDAGRAFELFNESLVKQSGLQKIRIDLQGFYFEWALLLSGLFNEALEQAEASHTAHQQLGWQVSAARSLLSKAEALRRLERYTEAAEALDRVHSWASEKNEKELLAWSRLVRARIYLDTRKIEDGLEEARIGLQTAKVNGFGLLAIDLQNVVGALALAGKDREGATTICVAALQAATGPDCGYVHGAREASTIIDGAKGSRGSVFVRMTGAFVDSSAIAGLRAKIMFRKG